MVPVGQHYIPQDEQLFTIILSCEWVHTKLKNRKRTFQLPLLSLYKKIKTLQGFNAVEEIRNALSFFDTVVQTCGMLRHLRKASCDSQLVPYPWKK